MDGHATYMRRHAKNDDFPIDFLIFTKALPTDRRTDGPTDGPIDGRTHPLIESWLTTKNRHLKSYLYDYWISSIRVGPTVL